MTGAISAENPYERKRVSVLDSEMAYIDTGAGNPIVFLHGNPTSSYLWRNMIPHLEGLGRCLAPDLISTGQSGKNPKGTYRFADHVRYLDAWFDALGLTENIVFVVHDWGSGLAFHWVHRHAERVRCIAYMEAIVMPITWDNWPERARDIFQSIRSPVGESIVLEKNNFVERILPASVLRGLTDAEMAVYREPYPDEESRWPTLQWPRELPIEGEPADTHEIVDAYSKWMTKKNDLPKLFINANPGSILVGAQREF